MRYQRLPYCKFRRVLKNCTRYYSGSGRPCDVCVVGSGPAGFYTAQQILKAKPNIHVDIYEKLPVPFGLVRFGVAPDHPEVKNVINTFTQTAGNERCSFIGNVTVGRDITIPELRESYSAVILSYGADDDRTLGIPGESLPNVLSARNFVGWYNGLPQDKHYDVNLDTDTAVILGQGNVALDVARILLTPVDILAKTDISEHSLEALRKSKIERVIIAGRRGPLHVAFTIKELREMIKLPGNRPLLHAGDFSELDTIIKDLARPRRRLTQLLYDTSLSHTATDNKLWSMADKQWELRFRLSPLEIMNDGNNVTGVKFGHNTLEGSSPLSQKAVLTKVTEEVDCGLVLRSIGYRSINIDQSIPFDHHKGVVNNVDGRVTGEQGLYCSGWVGRGPVGVILGTMTDGFDVGKTVVKDIESGALPIKADRNKALTLLQERGIKTVSFEGWKKIDEFETSCGEKIGKPREKCTDTDTMIDIASR